MSQHSPRSKPKEAGETPSLVKYERNIDMLKEELMSSSLPTEYLYSKIRVGEEARDFFCRTAFGANVDRELRKKFAEGIEALLGVDPGDITNLVNAQVQCRAAIEVYNLVEKAIAEGVSAQAEFQTKLNDEEDA